MKTISDFHSPGASARLSASIAFAGAAILLAGAAFAATPSQPKQLPAGLAEQAVVLFSGKADEVAANWSKRGSTEGATWKVTKGAMIAGGGDIVSKKRFTDFYLHIEFKVPYMPEAKGQGRGNSGVFLQGRYEIQVLDSYGLHDPGTGDCGSVYGKAAPLLKAYRKPLEWQSYDIVFRAPRFDADRKMTENARVTVFLNGAPIQNNVTIPDRTWGESFGEIWEPGPIVLQDHGNPCQYRNVWVLPLPEQGAQHY